MLLTRLLSQAAVSAQLNKGDILVVLGAGGGLGHLAGMGIFLFHPEP